MKRFRGALLVTSMLLLFLSGCSGKTKAAEELRVGALKGPTTMGLLNLVDDVENQKINLADSFSLEMAAGADELLPKMVSGDLDIALVPANVAAVLYNKTQGKIKVIDINTLGVLYALSADESINSIEDIKGKTVYMTGKGTTPEYVFTYLLDAYGVSKDDISIEFKSEPTEVAAVLKEDPDAVAILPQPFATACMMQNEALSIRFDLTKAWDENPKGDGSRLVTGVTVVRSDYLNENEETVKKFMEAHKASVQKANSDVEKTAELVAQYGIIEKAPLAQKAIPFCNITYIDKDEMKNILKGYLNVLYEQDPASVGGALPGEDFYY